MSDKRIRQEIAESWTGYCLLYSEPVPGHEDTKFTRNTHFDISPLYGEEVAGVGTIIIVKKDDVGLHVVVQLKDTPTIDLLTHAWDYTVDTSGIEVGFQLNQQTGNTDKVLKQFPIMGIQCVPAGEQSDAVQTAVVIAPQGSTRRAKRTVNSTAGHADP